MKNDFNHKSEFSLFPIFEVLSLDNAEPFFKDAGLTVQPSTSLKELCRSFVQEYYNGHVTDKELKTNTLRRLEIAPEENTLQALHEWIHNRHENYREQNGQAREWVLLLGKLADYFVSKDYPLVKLEMADNKIIAIKVSFLTYIANVYRFRLRICEAQNSPLSSWDEYVYSKHTEGSSPLAWLTNQAIFMYRISLWQQIENLLEADEFELLGTWAIQQAQVMGQQPPSLVHFAFGNQKD